MLQLVQSEDRKISASPESHFRPHMIEESRLIMQQFQAKDPLRFALKSTSERRPPSSIINLFLVRFERLRNRRSPRGSRRERIRDSIGNRLHSVRCRTWTRHGDGLHSVGCWICACHGNGLRSVGCWTCTRHGNGLHAVGSWTYTRHCWWMRLFTLLRWMIRHALALTQRWIQLPLPVCP